MRYYRIVKVKKQPRSPAIEEALNDAMLVGFHLHHILGLGHGTTRLTFYRDCETDAEWQTLRAEDHARWEVQAVEDAKAKAEAIEAATQANQAKQALDNQAKQAAALAAPPQKKVLPPLRPAAKKG